MAKPIILNCSWLILTTILISLKATASPSPIFSSHIPKKNLSQLRGNKQSETPLFTVPCFLFPVPFCLETQELASTTTEQSQINSPSTPPLPVNKIVVSGFTVLEEEITEIISNFQNNQGEKLFTEVKLCSPEAVKQCDNSTITDKTLETESPKSPDNPQLIATVNQSQITFEDLLELRSTITQLYINQGYSTSGAFLQGNSDLDKGIAEIQVVEGEIEEIEIRGLNHLNKGYVRSRLERFTTIPFNLERLEAGLQLLQRDPLLEQVNAELIPSNQSGYNILMLQVKEANNFNTGVYIANNRSPSIGSTEGGLFTSYNNLLGIGDRFSAGYGITEGLDVFSINYAIPLNSLDGTLSLGYSNNDSNIIEADFQDLDISSESETFSLSLRQPLSKKPNSEFALGLRLDLRRSQTSLLDEPFSFSLGPEAGESKVTVLRFSQDWLNRSTNRVLAARSQFSFGLDAFDATINNTGTDGKFFAWIGQFQWVERLPSRMLLIGNISTQLTPDSLLALERFSIGGVDTVRGYRENQLVTDNGILGSLELRIPLTSNPGRLQLTPFFEIGNVWNNDDPDPNPDTIASLGLGLRWQINSDLNLRLDYGIPLSDVDNRGDSLQENGIHFSLRYQPF
ncbi:MAG: ShlB/FhaC/HecB family hemolysin secretion/activation protein [Symploca sp. SIO2E9]|nr:ShlB/FhaC/HecB family hemolysin secretion/activation protein [Symploca sp. SIO2E9]